MSGASWAAAIASASRSIRVCHLTPPGSSALAMFAGHDRQGRQGRVAPLSSSPPQETASASAVAAIASARVIPLPERAGPAAVVDSRLVRDRAPDVAADRAGRTRVLVVDPRLVLAAHGGPSSPARGSACTSPWPQRVVSAGAEAVPAHARALPRDDSRVAGDVTVSARQCRAGAGAAVVDVRLLVDTAATAALERAAAVAGRAALVDREQVPRLWQSTVPALQTHWLFWQTLSDGQILSQSPQLSGSERVSMQTPWQSFNGGGQTHCPITHTWSARQGLPYSAPVRIGGHHVRAAARAALLAGRAH